MSTPSSIRQQITDQIIAALEKDLVPWRRPWRTTGLGGRHANFQTKRPYSGVNPLLLEIHALNHGLTSNLWATFEQWKKLGCTVKPRPKHVQPGRWGCQVIFYKPVSKTTVDRETGEEVEDQFRLLKTFTVFNSDQVNGPAVEALQEPVVPTADHQTHEVAEALIEATGAKITIGGDRAVYFRPQPTDSFPNHTSGDCIELPPREIFLSTGIYYETVFHELAHWSEVRLGFDYKQAGYAMCELIAEIASCQVSAELGLNGEDFSNHVAYVKSWLAAMKNDSGYILRAATQASKVTDFLLSFVQANEPVAVEEGEPCTA